MAPRENSIRSNQENQRVREELGRDFIFDVKRLKQANKRIGKLQFKIASLGEVVPQDSNFNSIRKLILELGDGAEGSYYESDEISVKEQKKRIKADLKYLKKYERELKRVYRKAFVLGVKDRFTRKQDEVDQKIDSVSTVEVHDMVEESKEDLSKKVEQAEMTIEQEIDSSEVEKVDQVLEKVAMEEKQIDEETKQIVEEVEIQAETLEFMNEYLDSAKKFEKLVNLVADGDVSETSVQKLEKTIPGFENQLKQIVETVSDHPELSDHPKYQEVVGSIQDDMDNLQYSNGLLALTEVAFDELGTMRAFMEEKYEGWVMNDSDVKEMKNKRDEEFERLLKVGEVLNVFPESKRSGKLYKQAVAKFNQASSDFMDIVGNMDDGGSVNFYEDLQKDSWTALLGPLAPMVVDSNGVEVKELRDLKQMATLIQLRMPIMDLSQTTQFVLDIHRKIDANNSQSGELSEYYAQIDAQLKHGIRQKLNQTKGSEDMDQEKYARDCLSLAKLYSDEGADIDSSLVDASFASFLAKESLNLDNLSLQILSQKRDVFKGKEDLFQVINAEKEAALDFFKAQEPQNDVIIERLEGPVQSVEEFAEVMTYVFLSQSLKDGSEVPSEEDTIDYVQNALTSMGLSILDEGVYHDDVFQRDVSELETKFGIKLSEVQKSGIQLMNEIHGTGWFDWSKVGETYAGGAAKASAVIVGSVALGYATLGMSVVYQSAAMGVGLTAMKSGIYQQGHEGGFAGMRDAYGGEFAVNVITVFGARYIMAGGQLLKMKSSGPGWKEVIGTAHKAGAIPRMAQMNANSGPLRHMTVTMGEAMIDTGLATVGDHFFKKEKLWDAFKKNAVFIGVAGVLELGHLKSGVKPNDLVEVNRDVADLGVDIRRQAQLDGVSMADTWERTLVLSQQTKPKTPLAKKLKALREKVQVMLDRPKLKEVDVDHGSKAWGEKMEQRTEKLSEATNASSDAVNDMNQSLEPKKAKATQSEEKLVQENDFQLWTQDEGWNVSPTSKKKFEVKAVDEKAGALAGESSDAINDMEQALEQKKVVLQKKMPSKVPEEINVDKPVKIILAESEELLLSKVDGEYQLKWRDNEPIKIEKEVFSIGRHKNADLTIDTSPNISKRHLFIRIDKDSGGVELIDYSSLGTQIEVAADSVSPEVLFESLNRNDVFDPGTSKWVQVVDGFVTPKSANDQFELVTKIDALRKEAEVKGQALVVRATELPSSTSHKLFESYGARSKDVMVVGDLHGNHAAFVKNLETLGVIQKENGTLKWIGGDKPVVFLGDILADRTPEGLKIMKDIELLRVQAQQEGGDIVFLLGNHDDFAIGALMDGTFAGGVRAVDIFTDFPQFAVQAKGLNELLKWLPEDKQVATYMEFIAKHKTHPDHYPMDLILQSMRKSKEGLKHLERMCQFDIAKQVDDTLFVHTDLTKEMAEYIAEHGIEHVNKVYRQGLEYHLLGKGNKPGDEFDSIRNIFLNTYNRDATALDSLADAGVVEQLTNKLGIRRIVHGHSDHGGKAYYVFGRNRGKEGDWIEVVSVDLSYGKGAHEVPSVGVIQKNDGSMKLGDELVE